jgi:hypothetical protein
LEISDLYEQWGYACEDNSFPLPINGKKEKNKRQIIQNEYNHHHTVSHTKPMHRTNNSKSVRILKLKDHIAL